LKFRPRRQSQQVIWLDNLPAAVHDLRAGGGTVTKRAILVGLLSAGLLLHGGRNEAALAGDPVASAKPAPRTCIGISGDPSSADWQACGGIAADLAINHKADRVCFAGRPCVFDILLSNPSNTAFSGEIKLTDFLLTVDPNLDVTAVVKLPTELACKAPPATRSPFACVADIRLDPWEERSYRLSLNFTLVVPPTFRLPAKSCVTISVASVAAETLLPQQPLAPFTGRRYSCRDLALIVAGASDTSVSDVDGSGIGVATGPISPPIPGLPGPCQLQIPAADGQAAVCPVEPQTKRCADGRVVPIAAVCRKTCPDGSYVAETATCPPPTKRCADGRHVPVSAVCMKSCPDGSYVPESSTCPPQTKRCADGRHVPVSAVCMKSCPDGSYVPESATCPPPTKRCADGSRVPVSAVCMKSCPDGSYVPENSTCPPQTKRCADGRYIPVTMVCMKTCQDGSNVPESEACEKTCRDGSRVPINQTCQKQCPDGSSVAENAACPQRCRGGMVGTPPYCACPSGTRWNIRFGRCVATCEPYQVGTPPNCRCPPGMGGPRCARRIR
jgi:hypothetical protein